MAGSRKSVRRIGAAEREKLSRLAEILCDFLPLDSHSRNTVTFRTIFAQSNIAGYFGRAGTKKQALENALLAVYRYHERLPRILIRKIVPAAVAYRKSIRNPLRHSELNELASCLHSLGIDMREELARVELDERLPRITVPPKKLEQALRQHDLEPEIQSEPIELFSNGHFNEAVRKAAERFEAVVREKWPSKKYGRELMANAFANGELLRLDDVRPDNREGFVDGYKLLAMGLMAAIRNVFSHGDEEARRPEECFEMLLFINWMFRLLKR